MLSNNQVRASLSVQVQFNVILLEFNSQSITLPLSGYRCLSAMEIPAKPARCKGVLKCDQRDRLIVLLLGSLASLCFVPISIA